MEVTYNKNKIPLESEFGDLIVGSYNSEGGAIRARGVAGESDEINRIREMFERSAIHAGATKLPTAKTSKRVPKPKKPQAKQKTKPQTDSWPEHEVRGEEIPVFNPKDWEGVDNERDTEESPVVKRDVPKKKVKFSNNFGKIKMSVEHVMECEIAYGLIFANDDDIIFTPKPGETLLFTNDAGFDSYAYYPDALFTLPDGDKKLMILFKSQQSNPNTEYDEEI